MRTETKIINIYKYDELSEKAKENAKDIIKDIIIDDNFYFLNKDLKNIALDKYDLQNIEFCYSLSFCQGDGLMFKCDDLLESKYIYKKVIETLSKEEAKRAAELVADGRLKFYSHNSKSYCYAHKNDVDYCAFGLEDNNYDLADKIHKIIADIYLNICKELEKVGYNCYNVTDEMIDECIEHNEIEFTENGEIY